MSDISIFRISVMLMLLFSGSTKLINFKYTKTVIQSIDIFPLAIAKVMGNVLPLFEIAMFFLLVYVENVLIYMVPLAYLLFFIGINIRFVNDSIKCCCYGKLIPSKLGSGGLLHYSYWIVVIIMDLLTGNSCVIQKGCIAVLIAIMSIINSLVIRRLLEVVYER